MSLSKIVQESLSEWEQIGTGGHREQIQSSLHKMAVSIIEAEISRKKGMLKEYSKKYTCICDYGEPCENCLSGYYNQAIQEDITYLQEQIELIKKMA